MFVCLFASSHGNHAIFRPRHDGIGLSFQVPMCLLRFPHKISPWGWLVASCGSWAAELEKAYLPTTIEETVASSVWITDLLSAAL